MVFRIENHEAGSVAASLMLYTVTLPSRNLAVIEEVQTKEEFRRQGRATQLIHMAIDAARGFGCDCVELTVREDKPEIKKFYENLGFEDRLNNAMRLKL